MKAIAIGMPTSRHFKRALASPTAALDGFGWGIRKRSEGLASHSNERMFVLINHDPALSLNVREVS